MEPDRSSHTAEFTAAMRADHRLHDADLVFDDAFALQLIQPELRASVEKGEYRAMLERTRPAFVTWIGVTMYLPAAITAATLAQIRASVAPGSELVFDYPIPLDQLDPEALAVARTKNAGLARIAEPRITTYDPPDLAHTLVERGFALIEDVGPAELDARYCAGRRDGL